MRALFLSGSDCDYYAKCSHYANQNQLDCTGEFTNLFIINVTFVTIVTIVKANKERHHSQREYRSETKYCNDWDDENVPKPIL